MSFDVLEFSLASSVADSGTVTASYPDGKSKGNYNGQSGKHVLVVGQNVFHAPADFTLTFNANASGITVTNASGATWAQGEDCVLQVERAGPGHPDEVAKAAFEAVRVLPQGLFFLDLGSPDVADDNGICASQSVTIATTPLASLNGALASGGEVILDVPRNVVAAWTGTAVLTMTAKDEYGVEFTEASASGTSFTGKKAVKEVVSISMSANVTGLTVGTGDVLGLPIAVLNASQVVGEFRNGVLETPATGRVYLQGKMLEAAVDAGTSYELVSPVAGVIRKLSTVSAGDITTGGNVTVEVNGTAVDGLSVTVANSAVAGEVDSGVATYGHASTAVAVGDRIEIIPSSGFNASADISFVLEIDASPALRGAFVPAVVTEPTATSGDVRGTYDPLEAADGEKAFGLLVRLADPANLGLTQYAA
jgi:hypothetical protein